MRLRAVDEAATTLAKNEIDMEEGMTTIATDGEIEVTTIKEIHGTVLIVNIIQTMIRNDGEIRMAGREVPMGVIRGVDGLVQQGV
jgi:hypothetical protein